jgi:hypothetical protein
LIELPDGWISKHICNYLFIEKHVDTIIDYDLVAYTNEDPIQYSTGGEQDVLDQEEVTFSKTVQSN